MASDRPDRSPAATGGRWSDLAVRTGAGAVLATIVLAAVWIGGVPFVVLVALGGVILLREWTRMTAPSPALFWRPLGLVYATVPSVALIWLRLETGSVWLVLGLLLVVWATDICAYFAGRLIGGPKLAPRWSPNKTWAGLGGAMAGAAAVAAFMGSQGLWSAGAWPWAALLAVVAQAGDLAESAMKRHFGVKDSGSLIPGHGGLMDRVDGLVTAAPLFALLVTAGLIRGATA